MISEREALRLILRDDLVSFIQRSFQTVVPGEWYRPNWHIEAIAWHLEQCLRGRITRLIITLPPRYLKSICASVAFPAWILGHNPSYKVICASYSNELTAKHARDCRLIMSSDWYRAAFPGTRLDPEKNAELEFMTTARGFRYGTSIGGTLTGRGGNFLIIDDPLKPSDAHSQTKREGVKQWNDHTLVSRLDNKAQDVMIIVSQRLHIDDLVGHVLSKSDAWTILNLPAIAEAAQRIAIGRTKFYDRQPGELLHPERESRATLEQIREALGSQAFSAQYQQEPVPPGGALIKPSWFKTYRSLPPIGEDDRLVLSWDTASKADQLNDYSVCTTWLIQGHTYYLIEVSRARLEFPDLRRRVIETALRLPMATVLIEDAGSGTHLIQELTRDGDIFPIGIRPTGDKLTRMAARAALIEAGHVHIPEEAPWLADFLTEMMQFPHGRHDDQVDSVAQFLNWAEERRANWWTSQEIPF